MIDLDLFQRDIDEEIDVITEVQHVSEVWRPPDSTVEFPLKARFDAKYHNLYVTPPTSTSNYDVLDVSDPVFERKIFDSVPEDLHSGAETVGGISAEN